MSYVEKTQQHYTGNRFMKPEDAWVDTYVDSGIHSGTSTRGPGSVHGINDDVWQNDEETTRAQRIRATLFPDTLVDEQNAQNFVSNGTSAVEKLTEPSQLLRSAVVSLVHYQDDADLAQRALPELVKLLVDEDLVVVSQAASMVNRLARREASRVAVTTHPNLISAVVNAINRASCDPEISRHAAGVLHAASLHPDGLSALCTCGGIGALVKLLDSSLESPVFYAITTLHNLLLHQPSSKSAVRSTGSIQRLVRLLNRTNPKFLAVVTDCLQILAYGSQETKLIILACDGPAEVLRIFRTVTYEKLAWTCSRLLKVLSACPSNKQAILNFDGMAILCQRLQDSSQRVMHNCLYIIRNLSDQAVQMDGLDVLIRSLVEMLTCTDSVVVSCAAGILSNLTCNNQYNKAAVVQYNGVEALVRVLIRGIGDESLIEPVLCTLRHITSRHPHASNAQDSVRLCFGIPAIVKLLSMSYSWDVVKAVTGVVRNLTLCHNNLIALRENGTIQRIVELLKNTFKESVCDSGNKSSSKLERIVEGAVGALSGLAKDEINRNIIMEKSTIDILVQFLYSPSVLIQRVVGGLLCEIANEPEGMKCIENSDGADILTTLLKSDDEGVATYAAAILFRMTDDKSFSESSKNNYALPSSRIPQSTDSPLSATNPLQPSGGNSPRLEKRTLQPSEVTWFDTDL